MPGWQERLREYSKAKQLVVVGVVQEQHPERARLYQQWRQLDWPLAIDPLNQLDYEVVPVPVLIDEHGVVQRVGRISEEHLKQFVAAETAALGKVPRELATAPKELPAQATFRQTGDWWFLWGAESSPEAGTSLDLAVRNYGSAVDRDANDARALFRLGVALRRRFESPQRQPGDAQRAVDMWQKALTLRPSQYIWRRRIQQYGPLLTKPYNFYAWVEEARREIRQRGETPVSLRVEPFGSEVIGRTASSDFAPLPLIDPKAQLPTDEAPLVRVEVSITPPRVRPGGRARVRLYLDPGAKSYWNNEAESLSVSWQPVDGVRALAPAGKATLPKEAETREPRIREFELVVPSAAPAGPLVLMGYVSYAVCEAQGGVCRYLRQDFPMRIVVDPDAQEIR
ncbi:MAG: hypothetical protein AAF581_03075 [Planctomycetota bacterium]